MQAAHAAIEAGRHALFPPDEPPPHLVLCGSRCLETLEGVVARLKRHGIAHRAFFEPDLAGELTAVCTAPLRGAARRPLRRYSVLSLPTAAKTGLETTDIHAASISKLSKGFST